MVSQMFLQSLNVLLFSILWDEEAKVPYMTDDRDGSYAFGYEDLRSLSIKCRYILEKGLHGAMYWSHDGDNAQGDLRRTVYETLNP